MVEAFGIGFDDIVKKNVLDGTFRRGYAEDTRERAGNGSYSEVNLRIASAALQ